MGNRIALAVLIASIGACSTDVAPPQAEFDAPQKQPSSMRYRMDPARNRLWVLTSDGLFVYDARTPRKIVEVDLPEWLSVDTQYSCPPDLTLGPKGEAVVTSNIVPTLWRIDPETLAVSVHQLVLDADSDKDVGFSGLAYSAEHKVFFAVSDVHRSLWRIDPLFRRGQKIGLSAPIQKACGIALRSRVAQYPTHRLAGLCVRTQQGVWTVELAPDLRSAYVRATSCVGQ